MKKITLLFYFIGALSISLNAQSPDYGDLTVYFADGNFEKLLRVAEKYTTNDNTRKDAIPYLYLSKANLEISKGGYLLEKYPRAFKDAIKYASKCIKYDTDGAVFESELEHFRKCKEGVFEQMRNLTEADDFGRLTGVIPLMEKLEKYEVGTAFLKAVAKYRRGDKSGFRTEESIANLILNEKFDPNSIKMSDYDNVEVAKKKKLDRQVILFGIEQYCMLVVEKGEKQKAKNLLKQMEPWFKDDKKYEELVSTYGRGY